MLLIINDLKQLIIDTQTQIGNNEILLVTYFESCLYYIMSVGNVSDQEEFARQLNTIPVVREKIMGTLARKFEQQGIEQGIRKTALAMIKEGADLNFISKVTQLTVEEIKSLK